MHAHLYFVDGLLIDTGQSTARKQILAATKDLPIEQVLVTHHHEDHTGNVSPIVQKHQCPVYSSKLCSELMHAPPPLSFAQKITWGNRETQHKLIPIEGTIETANHTFQIIPIPGHAPDMVALYEPNRKWLFSADLYINSYISYFMRTESMAEQIASTKRILELDFEVMFCGHKPRLQDGKEHLTKKLQFLESFFDDVQRLHIKGYTANEIFKQLRLKEDWFVRFLSGGDLSKLNMVRSVIRDVETSH